jgi:tetratricopeptide (TPR) repeat protein
MTRPRCLLLAMLVAAGAIGWWLWPRATLPVPPVVDVSNAEAGVAEAIGEARQGVEQSPSSAVAWGRLGLALRAHDFRGEATRCFAQAERLDPADPRWPYHQALELLSSEPDAGLACLQRAANLEGPTSVPRLLLGEVLLSLGRDDEAEQQFRRVLEREDANPRAHHGLARLAFARGDLTASAKHARAALHEAPWASAPHALLAEIAFRQGDRKTAEEERRRVEQLRAETPWPDPYVEEVTQFRVGAEPRIDLAAQLLRQGRTRQALGLLQETVARYPASYDARMALGKAFLRLPDYPAAEEALEEAVRQRPDDPAAPFHLGIALERQKRFREAADCYAKAVALKPDYAFAHYNRGQCLKSAGDQTGALHALREAVRYKPNFAEGRRDLGELLARNGQADEARIQLQQAVQLNPADEKARRLLKELRPSRK